MKKILKKILIKNFLFNLIFILIEQIYLIINRVPYFIFLNKIHKKLEVSNGIFKGLIYPEAESYGSVFYPKILGVYEYQLIDWIKKSSKKKYDEVINIGAAEGYYSVGYLKYVPSSNVVAIDTDEKALSFLKKLAEKNNVLNRLQIIRTNAESYLKQIDPNKTYLIICDCEGCEYKIFNENTIKNLSNSDLIIEMHYNNHIDNKYIFERQSFLENFKKTHNYEIKKHQRISVEDVPELKQMPIIHAKKLLNEVREKNAEWIMLEKK